jgi:fructokinase
MEYNIVSPVAWDEIEWNDDLPKLLDEQNYFVYGSLVARNTTSRDTLFRLLEIAKNKVLDINLRPPHYDDSLLKDLLSRANIAKLNYAELNFISSWYGSYASTEDKMKVLLEKFGLGSIIVTKGGDGAMINTGGKTYSHPGFKVVVQDTVGSGDSFLAAVISGLIEKREPSDILEFACALGALVTSKKGGWPEYEPADVRAAINLKK